MMKVLSRSRAESTSDAVREMDDELRTADPFATTSTTLTTVFTTRNHVSYVLAHRERKRTIQRESGNPVSSFLLLFSTQ